MDDLNASKPIMPTTRSLHPETIPLASICMKNLAFSIFNLPIVNSSAESAFDFRRDSRNVHFAKRVQIQIVRNALVQHETTGTGIQNERTDVSTVGCAVELTRGRTNI